MFSSNSPKHSLRHAVYELELIIKPSIDLDRALEKRGYLMIIQDNLD